MTTDRRARAHELVDLLLGETPASAETVGYDAMTDEELLKSEVGTRVRKILFHQLEVQGQEFYDSARLKSSASATIGGVTLARDWIYPEDVWDGFYDADTWEPPYKPTDEARAELMRRIAAADYNVERDQVNRWANDIAEAHGWGEEPSTEDDIAAIEEAPEKDEADVELVGNDEPRDWGIVHLSHRTQNPLRRATVHKAPCATLSRAVNAGRTTPRTLADVWKSITLGYYADGPEPPTNLTTVYTLCSACDANEALRQAKGDDLDAWKRGARLKEDR